MINDIIQCEIFIPISWLSIFSMIVMWKSSQWLGKSIGVLVKRIPGKHELVHWLLKYKQNNIVDGIKHHSVNQSINSGLIKLNGLGLQKC